MGVRQNLSSNHHIKSSVRSPLRLLARPHVLTLFEFLCVFLKLAGSCLTMVRLKALSGCVFQSSQDFLFCRFCISMSRMPLRRSRTCLAVKDPSPFCLLLWFFLWFSDWFTQLPLVEVVQWAMGHMASLALRRSLALTLRKTCGT